MLELGYKDLKEPRAQTKAKHPTIGKYFEVKDHCKFSLILIGGPIMEGALKSGGSWSRRLKRTKGTNLGPSTKRYELIRSWSFCNPNVNSFFKTYDEEDVKFKEVTLQALRG